jgi:hypothetical protein
VPSRQRLLDPCLCGFAPTSIYSTQQHRRTCTVWLSRDRNVVNLARRYETLVAKGLDPSRLCEECRRVEHLPTCSRRPSRREPAEGEESVVQAITAGFPRDWIVSTDEPQMEPMQVVSFIRAPECVSYRVTLSCGHTLLRRRIPKAAYCRKCQR